MKSFLRTAPFSAAVLLLCAVFSLLSCSRQPERNPASQDEPLAIGFSEWLPSEGARILHLVDSLEQAGSISKLRANYNRGVAYDMMRRSQVAEMYYWRAYDGCDPAVAGWDVLFAVAERLAAVRMDSGDYEGALILSSEMIERAQKANELTDERKINLLWHVGSCQYALGMIEEWEDICSMVYDYLRKEIRNNGWVTSERMLVLTATMTTSYIDRGEYAKAAYWQSRTEEELSLYAQNPVHQEILKGFSWRSALSKVFIRQAQGHPEEADALFQEVMPQLMETPEGLIRAAEYLMQVGRADEAIKLYDQADAIMPDGPNYEWMNLSRLQDVLIPRMRASLAAGRSSESLALAQQLCESFDQALIWEKQDNAAELATIFDTHLKDEQIASQKAEMSRMKVFWIVAVFLLICLFFIVYDRVHRRHLKMLSEEHRKLEEAYGELAMANLRVEESSRMKSHFIQQISHEIRTPLNILSGFSQIITAKGMDLGDEEKAQINHGILENTGRITSLVSKMLDLSDAVSDKALVTDEFVSAGQIAQAAVKESGICCASHLQFEMDEAAPEAALNLNTNLAQASHALALLLGNAEKFTHLPGGTQPVHGKQERVALVISRLKGRIAFAVEDSGIGVPPREVEHIFEEFVQLDDYYEGTGIGLTVARSLARRLGGDIILDTTYTGGARFVMTLPLAEE